MKRIRMQRPKARRERPGREALPPDPRDPDVVRAKALARAGHPRRLERHRNRPCATRVRALVLHARLETGETGAANCAAEPRLAECPKASIR